MTTFLLPLVLLGALLPAQPAVAILWAQRQGRWVRSLRSTYDRDPVIAIGR